MIKKLAFVVAMIAATCFAGLVFSGPSEVKATSSTTVAQNDNRNRDMDRGDRRRHRRHNRRWRRHNRRHRRHNGNMNR
jgi:hypothetical protein